jgi:hypothetical protein
MLSGGQGGAGRGRVEHGERTLVVKPRHYKNV